ncbi:hypothetical protein CA54_40840 [Symmachiella macrocystis]|uniref:Uncharacterized protein n=1 Tax=Symmachiella macrocystis TaxID=2527985 RepID=A0A5C6BAV0_9PLAN|nr:hypothetical protein [Symmachiella macrocystis]TWU08847.1 hypothetical protein CA54_40840 [Symmachiella macrocystis]
MNEPTPAPAPEHLNRLFDAFAQLDPETLILLKDGTLGDAFRDSAPRLHWYLATQLAAVVRSRQEGLDGVVVQDPNWPDWEFRELLRANRTAIASVPSAVSERQRDFLETVAGEIAVALEVRWLEPDIKRFKNFEAN